jgi:hypothetical protein
MLVTQPAEEQDEVAAFYGTDLTFEGYITVKRRVCHTLLQTSSVHQVGKVHLLFTWYLQLLFQPSRAGSNHTLNICMSLAATLRNQGLSPAAVSAEHGAMQGLGFRSANFAGSDHYPKTRNVI